MLPLTKNPPLKRFHVAHADRNDSKKNNQLICKPHFVVGGKVKYLISCRGLSQVNKEKALTSDSYKNATLADATTYASQLTLNVTQQTNNNKQKQHQTIATIQLLVMMLPYEADFIKHIMAI